MTTKVSDINVEFFGAFDPKVLDANKDALAALITRLSTYFSDTFNDMLIINAGEKDSK